VSLRFRITAPARPNRTLENKENPMRKTATSNPKSKQKTIKAFITEVNLSFCKAMQAGYYAQWDGGELVSITADPVSLGEEERQSGASRDYDLNMEEAFFLFNHRHLLREEWDEITDGEIREYCRNHLPHPYDMEIACKAWRMLIESIGNRTGDLRGEGFTIVFTVNGPEILFDEDTAGWHPVPLDLYQNEYGDWIYDPVTTAWWIHHTRLEFLT
jgi:hypothetical protein